MKYNPKGAGEFDLDTVVLDLNGTLAVNGLVPDGVKEKIAPWQLTDKYMQDPVIDLAAVRPDFNGALIQFLIGLLQTTCAPQGDSDWRAWMKNPPSPEELKDKFETVAPAFNLDGDGSRFMQDLTIEKEETKITEIIDKLLELSK